MTSIVLVHGTFHWGGCWQAVVQRLAQDGITVYTPTLRLDRSATLATHIDTVVQVLDAEDLHEAVLVGHSYGGAVVAGVLGRRPSRVGHTVFLDAVIPQPGRSVAHTLGGVGLHWLMPMMARDGMIPVILTAEDFGVTDPNDVAWLTSHLQPHPLLTYTEPFAEHPHYDPARCTYLACAIPLRVGGQGPLMRLVRRIVPTNVMAPFYAQARAAGWRTALLEGGHNAMIIAPDALADQLRAVIAERNYAG